MCNWVIIWADISSSDRADEFHRSDQTYINSRFWIPFPLACTLYHRRDYLLEVFRQCEPIDIFEQSIGRREQQIRLELVEQCRVFLE